MMRAFDTLQTRTVLVSLLGITLTHVLSLWSYEATLDRNPMAGSAHASSNGMLLSTTVMAVGIVLLCVLIARWLTRPIVKMASAVRELHPDSAATLIPGRAPGKCASLALPSTTCRGGSGS